jgi:hypothetical protein
VVKKENSRMVSLDSPVLKLANAERANRVGAAYRAAR